ncbi:hypothetical protein TNCV_2610081 [Trichonephila clavipes]|nr:hypothetical protein TNCV_2610081 [Trichonephila clavipes]
MVSMMVNKSMSPDDAIQAFTTPRHAGVSNYQSDFGEYYTTHQAQCPRSSDRQVEWVDGRIRRSSISPTCSIGFKSGEYAGQTCRVISSD